MTKYSKYKSKKTTVDGFKFDSKKEANRYQELKALQREGRITGLCMQVPFVLQDAYIRVDGKRIRAIKYIADFVYKDADGNIHVEDVKGMRTAVYNLKKKIFEKRYKIKIEEVK